MKVKSDFFHKISELYSESEEIKLMFISFKTEGGNRDWKEGDDFRNEIREIVKKYKSTYVRTPEEEEELRNAIHNW